jgi:hypothetical protein
MPETPLIIRGGQAVCPAEIETVLRDHPAVAEAAVVGVPDQFWGQLVAAAVRLTGPTPEAAAELTEYCRSLLSPYKVPTRWLFTGSLPRTATGQPCRATLTALLSVASGPDRSSWVAQSAGALAGPPALDPFGIFRISRIFRQAADTEDLRLPQQRESCGLEGLDYL